MKTIHKSLAVLASVLAIGSATAKDSINDIVLQISGRISNFNSKDGKSFNFTMTDLKAIGDRTIVCRNKYIAPPYQFTGPLFRDVLAKAGLLTGAKEVVMSAADGYIVRAPINDFNKWDVVIGHATNGIPMTIKSNGPLWTAYPLGGGLATDAPETDTTHAKMSWSLTKIRVL